MSLQEVPCPNPGCDHFTVVRETPATRYEPSDVDRTECEECGETLDFEDAEPFDREAHLFDQDEDRYKAEAGF